MPTFKVAHPWLVEAVKKADGIVVRVGSKPWAHFMGEGAEERAQPVLAVYEQIHGLRREGVKAWREDQEFGYAIRLD